MAIRNKIIIKSRLKVLKKTVMELFEESYSYHKDKFSSYNSILKTLDEGIEKEYLRKVSIIGLKDNEVINRLVLFIDWKQHKILCESSDKTYEFTGGKSISEQVSKALPVLSLFVRNSIRSGSVNKLKVHYNYKHGVDNQLVDEELGLSNISDEYKEELNKFEQESFEVEINPENLEELSISFRTKTDEKYDKS